MRIAGTATYTMALNAIRRRAMVVAGHAGERITPRRAPVELRVARIAPHPANWVSIDCARTSGADTACNVATVATLRIVAAQAGCRTRTSLDAVAHQEVADVLELSLDAVGLALLDRQTATLIMTVGAPGLRVTGLTDCGLSHRGNTVALEPGGVVAQKSLRQKTRQLRANVARRAIRSLEVALMTLEALGHGRGTRWSLRLVDHASVTRDTLPMNWPESQVLFMGEDDPLGAFGLRAGKPQRPVHQ